MNNGDKPAYPVEVIEKWTESVLITDSLEAEKNGPFHTDVTKSEPVKYPGLSKREMFAMAAMQGLLSDCDTQLQIKEKDGRYNGGNFAQVVAMNAVEFADELLKQLESK